VLGEDLWNTFNLGVRYLPVVPAKDQAPPSLIMRRAWVVRAWNWGEVCGGRAEAARWPPAEQLKPSLPGLGEVR